MTIRERVAEFDALTKAHPDERYICLSVAADRHDLLVAGDALYESIESPHAHDWTARLNIRAALAAWKAAAG